MKKSLALLSVLFVSVLLFASEAADRPEKEPVRYAVSLSFGYPAMFDITSSSSSDSGISMKDGISASVGFSVCFSPVRTGCSVSFSNSSYNGHAYSIAGLAMSAELMTPGSPYKDLGIFYGLSVITYGQTHAVCQEFGLGMSFGIMVSESVGLDAGFRLSWIPQRGRCDYMTFSASPAICARLAI